MLILSLSPRIGAMAAPKKTREGGEKSRQTQAANSADELHLVVVFFFQVATCSQAYPVECGKYRNGIKFRRSRGQWR